MMGKLYKSTEAASVSASQRQIIKKQRKDRPRYSYSTKACHLTDKSATFAYRQAEKQFAKSSLSITAEPGINTNNWAKSNLMLVESSNTGVRPSCSSTNARNTLSATAPHTTMNVFVHDGGRRKFLENVDDILNSNDPAIKSLVCKHHRNIVNPGVNHRPTTNIVVRNANEIDGYHKSINEERRRAEEDQSVDEAADDSESGTVTEETCSEF